MRIGFMPIPMTALPRSTPGAAEAPPRASSDRLETSPAAAGFYHHLRDAMANNETRKAYYASRTNGASRSLSNRLIALEALTLPFAAYFDARAERFNRDGVGIVRDDFISMRAIKPPETPPRYTAIASEADVKRLEGWIDRYRAESAPAIARHDYRKVAELSDSLLSRVEGLEASSQSHFAMTKHIVESVGYAAAHAVAYEAQSHGKTDDLASRFLSLQAFGLTGSLSLDREAQTLQHQGIGILVNDVPAIPLHEAFGRLKDSRGT